MAAKVDAAGIPSEVLASLGIQVPGGKSGRRRSMTQDEVRGYAIRSLAPLASLTKRERVRVLKHALKVNEV